MSYTRDSELDLVYNSETDSYEPVAQEYVLTINPTPSDATVVLTATGFEQEGNSITVNSGTTVSYVISKTGYKTVSDEITVTEDQTLAISLVVDTIIHIQHLRGTTSQINNYIGKEGEITYDTITHALRVHDGIKKGGYEIGGSSSSDYHPDLFDYKWADHILNDAQWLRSDTFSWQSGAVYQAAYQHLVNDYNSFQEVWEEPIQVESLIVSEGGNYWGSIVWDGTKFIAVNRNGWVSTSTDGETWTTATKNTNLGVHNWISSAYGNSKIVVIGDGGYISTSTDGITWTTATLPTELDVSGGWYSICWNGTKFVALSPYGYIATSIDGITWVRQPDIATSYPNGGWQDISYGNGKFVAIGPSGQISTSIDAETWSEMLINPNLGKNNWSSIYYSDSKFIALSRTGYTSTSTDGETWTPAVLSSELSDKTWGRVRGNGVKLLAVSYTNYLSSLKLYNSEIINGITVKFHISDDGHKICPVSEESNVESIYNATGVAWYYIIDTTNQRFKLPRSSHNKYTTELGVIGTGKTLGLTDGTNNYGLCNGSTYARVTVGTGYYGSSVSASSGENTGTGANRTLGVTTNSTKSGIKTTAIEQDTDQYKYLYFYVGNFTQTALENTAGVTTEVLNGKADLDLSNITTSAMSTLFSAISPDYSQGTTLSQNTNYTATEDCWLYVSVNSSAEAAGADVNKTLTIGGQDFRICSWAYDKNVLFMPCPKGTAFKLTNNNTGQGSYEFKKYPCKGI